MQLDLLSIDGKADILLLIHLDLHRQAEGARAIPAWCLRSGQVSFILISSDRDKFYNSRLFFRLVVGGKERSDAKLTPNVWRSQPGQCHDRYLRPRGKHGGPP